MNILSSTPKKQDIGNLKYTLSFYFPSDLDELPEEVTIDQFEQYAEYRMQLYLMVDKNELVLKTSGGDRNPNVDRKVFVDPKDREKDIYSHFVMRAAFCTSNLDRLKFVERETRLFEYRLSYFEGRLDHVIQASRETLEEVTIDQMNRLFPSYESDSRKWEDSIYYAVDFERVPRQLSRRKVLLHRGKAYITKKELPSFLVSQFEDRLRDEIEHYSEIQHQFRDPRIEEALKQLTVVYTQEENLPSDTISPASIPRLAKQSFPLCMMRMYKKLCDSNHLFYDGREQFGRFLKGIGLSMEGALEFFQHHFCRAISIDKFNKEYSYNIRYMYGKEGRRIALNPHPCRVLIKTIPSGDQCHGCPFACMRDGDLEVLLKNLHINGDSISNILSYHRERNYEKACREYFMALHPDYPNEGIAVHPVLWFKKSRDYYAEKEQSQQQ